MAETYGLTAVGLSSFPSEVNPMPDAIRIPTDADLDTIHDQLTVCSRYPHSPQRTASCDVLLDMALVLGE